MSDRTTIIHISDIHFGPNLIPIGNVNEHGLPHTEEIIPTGDILFINWLDRTIPLEDRSNCFLVVTGDVSSAGRSEEFEKFYKIARHYGTRSLNIDSNSVFFWSLLKKEF